MAQQILDQVVEEALPEYPIKLEVVVEQVRSAATDCVLVVATEGTVRVFGYR